MQPPRRPRTHSVMRLTDAELLMLTPEFLSALPRTQHFPTRSAAFAFRLYVYKILSAGRQDGNPSQQYAADTIGVTQPQAQPGQGWAITLYSRTSPGEFAAHADIISSLVADLPTAEPVPEPQPAAPYTPATPQPLVDPFASTLAALGYGAGSQAEGQEGAD